jgi:hypothetical protein
VPYSMVFFVPAGSRYLLIYLLGGVPKAAYRWGGIAYITYYIVFILTETFHTINIYICILFRINTMKIVTWRWAVKQGNNPHCVNISKRNPPILNRIQKQSIVFIIFISLAFNSILSWWAEPIHIWIWMPNMKNFTINFYYDWSK